MDRQSERLLLLRVYAFLKSRKLNHAAYALEQEALLRFDWPRVHLMIRRGRWRSADEYTSAFLDGGRESTPEACAALFLLRFQRFMRALKCGGEAWAGWYLARCILPVLHAHPDRDAASSTCVAVLRDRRALATQRDDAEARRACNHEFLGLIFQNDGFLILTGDDTELKRLERAASLGLRRYARPRRGRPRARRG
ncbi:hypothetical protein ACQJBY_049335 [Aegilops geniculata]